ncbi:MAG TPA: polysaccharide biosynthesis C-terminal domain-containing protein [Bacteroidales bacterium]|nr:polysaccharide biosynthesis C-terminal domain-containing protein [Bacteroidales bacterium]HSA43323.1 polysaccharide biosynthesis C-terminal domain-containing protein [Bacteroidales bacterium]
MFKKIIGTAGSRVIIAVLSLLMAFVSTRYLNAEGYGTIGMLVLGITIILLFTSLVGGTILVYLTSRVTHSKLLFVSYLWAIFVSVVFWLVMQFVPMVPEGYETHVMLLSLMFSFANTNLYLMLGMEKIKSYNLITTLQFVLQMLALLFFFLVVEFRTVMAYLFSLYIAYGFSWLCSSWLVFGRLQWSGTTGLLPVIREIFRLGSMVQIAYIIQMMNYRLSYFIINEFIGRAGVGLFHLGNQLAEGTWVVGKSMAIVQYSRISNTSDLEYARRFTLRLLKLTFLATLLIIIVLLLLPASFFALFGKEFTGTHAIILSLAVGILANGSGMMFSHYFAGRGKPHINTVGSSVGLVFTLILGFWLIPAYGIIGAGITASVSYSFIFVYELMMFIRIAKPSLKEFMFSRDDYRMLKEEIRKMMKKDELKGESLSGNLP